LGPPLLPGLCAGAAPDVREATPCPAMELVVRVAGHPCCSLWVEEGREASVRQLKAKIHSLLGIPREYQRLVYGGAEVWDDTRPLGLRGRLAGSLGAGKEACVLDLEVYQQARLPGFLARRGLVDLATRGPAGRNALHQAVTLADRGVCAEILLQAEPSVINATDGAGDTALHMAARHRSGDIGVALLLSGVFEEVNARNSEGYTALHLAAAYGCTKLCVALLECSLFQEANARDCRGRTALHHAAANGHAEVCSLLLADGAFTARDAEDHAGLTALDVARPRAFQAVLAGCRAGRRRASGAGLAGAESEADTIRTPIARLPVEA